jgi:hypothetical protein
MYFTDFSVVQRASGPVFMFSTPGLILDGTEGVKSSFHFFAPEPVLGGTEGTGSSFHFCSPEPVLGGTEGIGSSFDVLRSRTHFRHY